MDTSVDSLDNANNPFANSNGTTAESILSQKNDGLLLNLSDSYKQNGDEISPTVDFFKDLEKTNCKRSASDFDDDDDDLGPETDVDAVDDVLMSPTIAVSKLEPEASNNNHQFNPFAEVEKNTLEIDFDILKQQTSEFDVHRSPRDETPTPPVDSVHDAGGLIEAVAESDSEEEDEWNYVRGEQANKENIDPSQSELQVVEPLLEETEDSMSQLNPNAAEFVPISPTHSAPSPVCKMLNDEDRVLSQSPRKPVAEDVDDLSVPNPADFQNDVKSKPSEIEEPFSNGHQNVDNEQLLGDVVSNTNARMDLLGSMNKSLASDEFHFGPNAAPFTPVKLLDQSEVSSTKAVYGDDSVATLETSFNDSNISSQDQCDFIISNKTEDPMSMSFYQDKNEESSNPFDLNKVHVLPQDVDEFLNDPNDSFINDTISDLAEHFPLGNPETKDNDEKVQITDLDKDEGKELASPLEENSETEIVTKEDVAVSSCKRFSIEIEMPLPIEPVLMQPISPTIQPTVDICQKIASEDFIHNEILSSVKTPEPQENLQCVEEDSEITQGVKSRNLSESSSLDICEPHDENASLVEEDPTKISESSLEVCEPHTSRDPNSPLVEGEPGKTSESLLELCEHHALTDRNSPSEDVRSSVKDEFPLSKGDAASLQGDLLETETKVFSDEKDNLELETDTSIEGKQTPGACSSPKTDINTTCSFESPKSVDVSPLMNILDVLPGPLTTSRSIVDTESVTSAEVNSFLERSLLEAIVHPLSPDEPELDQLLNVDHPLSRCVYPLDHVIGESGDAPQLDNNELSYQNENSRPPWSCGYPLQPLPPQYQGMGDNKANDDLSSTISPIPSAPLEEDIEIVHLERGNAVEPSTAITIEDSDPVTQHYETPQITSVGDTTFTATNLDISKDGTETSAMNETQVETSLAAPLAAVAGIGVVGIAVAHAADKKAAKPKIAPPKKSTPYKITQSKSPAARTTTASKPSATSPQTNTASKTAFTSSKPSAPTKTAVAAAKTAASRISSSPTKTRVSTSLSPKSAERKPLTNGDTKSAAAITKKSVEGTVPRTTATRTNTLVPTRPPLKISAAGRTTSATATTKPATTANATGAKPRPNTLSAKPATARTTTSTYKPSLTLTKAPTTTKTAPVPKPRPITAPISTKPRVPLSRPTKTTPDTEKQNKESANKLTAARTSTTTPRSLASSLSKTTTTTSSVRKIESKVTGTRTNTTKTTTTALKTTSKKPIELIKNVSRTKTTKVEKPQQNGITTVITEQMTIINNSKNELNGIPCDPPLGKNNYPVDNKLIVDTLIDTSSAD